MWHRTMADRNTSIGKEMIQDTRYDMKVKENLHRNKYTTCLQMKSTKTTSRGSLFLLSDNLTKRADICGPLKTAIFGRNTYLVAMIAANKRYVRICLLNNRFGITEYCLNYISKIDRHLQQKVKRSHADNTLEFLALRKHLERLGVERTISSAYTPPTNGVAERVNRTPLNKPRAMPAEAGMNKTLRGEAEMYSKYVHNETITSTQRRKTP